MTIPHVKCDICNIILNSKATYEQHILGQKHKKKALAVNSQNTSHQNVPNLQVEATQIIDQVQQTTDSKTNFNCDKCGIVSMNESSYLLHVTGKKHKRKIQVSEQEIGPAKEASEFNCDVCKVSLASKDQLDAHLTGKKHLKKLNTDAAQAQVNSGFNCEICNLSLVSKDQLDIHLSGKKHLKKLTSLSKIAQISTLNRPKEEDDKKYENLNIAWDKYRINDQLRLETENKYEYFCALCNKYIQRKMQLVDHLKSKKHHRRIHEKRYNEKGLTLSRPTQNVIKPAGQKNSQNKYSKKIDFVPANANYNTVQNQNQQQNFYQNQQNTYSMYYQSQSSMQPNYNTKRKLDQSPTTNSPSKKLANDNSNNAAAFNPNYYGYGYDQSAYTNFSNDVSNFYWKTPISQSELNNRQPSTFNNQSNFNQNTDTNNYNNFAYNLLSNIQYSLSSQSQPQQQQQQQQNKTQGKY